MAAGDAGASTRLLEDRPAEGVLRLTLSAPDRFNALDAQAWRALGARLDALAGLGDDSGLCLLLDGTVPAFCSGGDINEYAMLADRPDAAAAYVDVYVAAMRRLRTLPMPTVACVDGPAVGAGLALATACDLRIASPRASFAVTAVKRGLVYPIEELARLASLAGGGPARDIVLRGVVLDVQCALECGLVSAIEPADRIRDAAVALAAGLSRSAGPVYAATKRLFGRVEAGMPLECDATRAIVLEAFGTDAFRTGTRDFLGERP